MCTDDGHYGRQRQVSVCTKTEGIKNPLEIQKSRASNTDISHKDKGNHTVGTWQGGE